MISRWYRSRLFWFGLTGLVMLLGVWMHRGFSFRLAFTTRHHVSYSMMMSRSAIVFASADNSPFANIVRPPKPGWEFRRLSPALGWSLPRNPMPFRWRKIEVDKIICGAKISVAIWFVVAAYTAAWTVGMIWWLRRKQRLMNAGGRIA